MVILCHGNVRQMTFSFDGEPAENSLIPIYIEAINVDYKISRLISCACFNGYYLDPQCMAISIMLGWKGVDEVIANYGKNAASDSGKYIYDVPDLGFDFLDSGIYRFYRKNSGEIDWEYIGRTFPIGD